MKITATIIDLWKSYVGKKVYVQTTEKGKNRRILGTLEFVDDKFILINTDNPSYYKEATTIALNKIEILTLLSNSYQSHRSHAKSKPSPSTPVQSSDHPEPKFSSTIIPKEEQEEYNRLMNELMNEDVPQMTPEEEESYLADAKEQLQKLRQEGRVKPEMKTVAR